VHREYIRSSVDVAANRAYEKYHDGVVVVEIAD